MCPRHPRPQILIISPQNIDDDLLLLFADSRLRHLHILQNCYSPSHQRIEACSGRAWRILKRDNPKLMVHLRVESLSATQFSEVLWQPDAPVHSVLYQAPQQMVSSQDSSPGCAHTWPAFHGRAR